MHMVAVPLFDQNLLAQAYMVRCLKGNILFSAAQATGIFDGASNSQALEMLSEVGIEAFTLGKPLFVPIEDYMLLGSLENQCKEPPEKIIFLFESPPRQEKTYLFNIRKLRALGYRFAVNYPFDPEKKDPVLDNASYAFLSQREERRPQTEKTLAGIKENYPNITPIAIHIYSDDMLKSLYGKGYALYESRFYKVSATHQGMGLPPLKVNAVRLIKTVQNEEFDFEDVTSVVKSDPGLTISLLNMVNAHHSGKRAKIKTIQQAVAMIGQKEVRKWVTTAVSKSLGDDRPSELTRISLIRAKFAENLAPLFEMAHMSGELFLMGLFSVIDVILELPLPEALEQVAVSDTIRSALVGGTGIFAPVMKLITDYESSRWSEVSREMLIYDIKEDDLSQAFLDTLIWYRNLIEESKQPVDLEPEPAAHE